MNIKMKQLIIEFVGTFCAIAAIIVIPCSYYDLWKGMHKTGLEITTSVTLVYLYAELISIAGLYLCYHGYKSLE